MTDFEKFRQTCEKISNDITKAFGDLVRITEQMQEDMMSRCLNMPQVRIHPCEAHREMFGSSDFAFPPRLDPKSLSWREIKNICNNGMARYCFQKGDTKDITLTDGEVITMRIIGFYHDQMEGGDLGKKAPITWETVDYLKESHSMNKDRTNKGGWAECEMRKYLNDEIYRRLPKDVKESICPVQKITSVGGGDFGMELTNDRLFLLSEQERYGRTLCSAWKEGTWYEWYRQEDVSYAKTYPDGDPGWGWQRSPCGKTATQFCLTYTTGSSNSYDASNRDGVSFAFCT